MWCERVWERGLWGFEEGGREGGFRRICYTSVVCVCREGRSVPSYVACPIRVEYFPSL